MGKTSLAMNIVEHVAVELKKPCAVFSLEMTADSLVQRLICARARINMRALMSGQFLNQGDFQPRQIRGQTFCQKNSLTSGRRGKFNRPIGPGYNSRDPDLLAKNMEACYGYPHPGREFTAHHIVPKRYPGDPNVPDSMARHARDANDVLDHYGISSEEACSGMYLPDRYAVDAGIELDAYGPLHAPAPPGTPEMHNKDYMRELATRLNRIRNIPGSTADDVRDELQRIALLITKKSFPGTRP